MLINGGVDDFLIGRLNNEVSTGVAVMAIIRWSMILVQSLTGSGILTCDNQEQNTIEETGFSD